MFVALGRLGRVGEPSKVAGASRAPSRRSALAWGIAALLFATTVAALYRPDHRPAETFVAPSLRSLIEFPNTSLAVPTLSPDGRYLSMYAHQGGSEGRTVLIRRLADGEVTWLDSAGGGLPVAWSPDSRSLAVFADAELKAVDVATGGIRRIGRVPTGDVRSGAWNRDGIILLSGSRLQRMSVADGHVTDVYGPGAEITSQSFPSFLPDGRTFLYAQESSHAQRRGVFLGSLDSPNVTRVLSEPANAVFSSRGYLLYGHQGTLFAQRFDLDHKRLMGEPLGIGSGIMFIGAFTSFAVADHMLVWSNGSVTPAARLTWFDRTGKTLGTTPEARPYEAIDLAPDERHVVALEDDPRLGNLLFLMDLNRSIHSRLTPGDQEENDPVWSPDSREVVFDSRGGLFTRRIDQEGLYDPARGLFRHRDGGLDA